MKDLVLHPETRRQIESVVKSPSQVLLVSAPAGSGKLTLAQRLAEQVMGLPEGRFASYQHGLTISPEDGTSIGIESSRRLERFMRLKVPAGNTYNRAVIIEDSHLMTTEAQNALLKTLEEPPAGTLIIMTVSYEPALLPTVRSRAQTLPVRRPDKQALKAFFSQKGLKDDEIDSLYALTGGSPGLINALIEEEDHPLKRAAEQARQLLSQPTYQRLAAIESLAKDKMLAADTVAVIGRMARLSLQNANGKTAKRWQKILKASYRAAEALDASAQPKLVLTDLALQF